MTLRLILMRHTKSSWDDPWQGDHARRLNGRGRRSAEALGNWLRAKGHLPDVALSSDAVRTQETFAGLALAWARALGEFGATITFAGNLPGSTRTLPLATFQALESDPEAALALSLVLLAVSLVVLLPTRDRWLPTR